MSKRRYSNLIARISAFKNVLSLAMVAFLTTVSGCGGGGTALQPTPTPTPSGPVSGSEFLYLQSYSAGIQEASITPATGTLSDFLTFSSTPGIFVMPWDAVTSSVFSPPNSKFVYFTGNEVQSNAEYIIGIWGASVKAKDGSLSLVPGADPLTPQTSVVRPTGMAMDGLGSFLYLSDSPNDNGIAAYRVRVFKLDASTGAVKEGPIQTIANAYAFNIQAGDSQGKYMYGFFNDWQGNLAISVFAIDSSTGALTEVPGSPFLAHSYSRGGTWNGDWLYLGTGMALSPSGAFLYASVWDFDSDPTIGNIYSFAIDSGSGALTAVPGSPFLFPNDLSSWLVVHPSGKFLYASTRPNTGSYVVATGVTIFPIDPVSGAITATAIPSVVDASCCDQLLIDPTGSVLMEEGVDVVAGTNTWSIFTVDSTTGGLVLSGTQIVPAGYLGNGNGGPAAIVRIP